MVPSPTNATFNGLSFRYHVGHDSDRHACQGGRNLIAMPCASILQLSLRDQSASCSLLLQKLFVSSLRPYDDMAGMAGSNVSSPLASGMSIPNPAYMGRNSAGELENYSALQCNTIPDIAHYLKVEIVLFPVHHKLSKVSAEISTRNTPSRLIRSSSSCNELSSMLQDVHHPPR